VVAVSILPLAVLSMLAYDQARTAEWRGYLVAGAFFLSGPGLYWLAKTLRTKGLRSP
jgi:hypothetical protein